MKVTLEPTTKIVDVNGVPARIWEGTTQSGIRVHAYVTRIAVPTDAPAHVLAQFEGELQETRAPSADVAAIPARLVL